MVAEPAARGLGLQATRRLEEAPEHAARAALTGRDVTQGHEDSEGGEGREEILG